VDDVVTITSRAMRSHKCGVPVSAARGKQVPAQIVSQLETHWQSHTATQACVRAQMDGDT
jgi:hypothetical protein